MNNVLAAVESARAQMRARVWALAGEAAPDPGSDAAALVIIDLDATLVTSHSDKEDARATFKRGYGFRPLCAFVDHGQVGTGEPVHVLIRTDGAGATHDFLDWLHERR